MKPKLLIGSGWVLSLAIAFWFGSLQEGPRLNDEGSVFSSISEGSRVVALLEEIDQQDRAAQKLRDEIMRLKTISGVARRTSSENGGNGSQSLQENFEGGLSASSLQERLQIASGPMERMSVLMTAFQGMDASNVEEVVAAFNENTEPNRRYSELRLLVYAWAEFDPQGAVEWADKLGGWEERSAVGAALERWAVKDLDASLAWARQKFKGEDNPYLVGIIGGLTKSNPARASELMLEMPYSRNRGRAATALLEAYWKKSEGEAMGWAVDMEDGSVKDYVTSQLAEKIARKDIGRSARWVESLDGGRAKNRAVGMVAYQWARKDPSAASKWIDGMGENESRFSGMKGLVRVWVDRDPAATAQWLNGYDPSEGKDGAVEIFVDAIKRKDPASAMEWAETMTDEKERREAVAEVERIWRRGNPETYKAWKQLQPPGQQ